MSKPKTTPEKVLAAAELLKNGDMPLTHAAEAVGIDESTLRRRLRSDDPLAPDARRPGSDIMEAVAKLVS